MPVNGAYTLGEIAAVRRMLGIACSRCDRRGRLSTVGLMKRFPADTTMPNVLDALAADCPNRRHVVLGKRCSVHMLNWRESVRRN